MKKNIKYLNKTFDAVRKAYEQLDIARESYKEAVAARESTKAALNAIRKAHDNIKRAKKLYHTECEKII